MSDTIKISLDTSQYRLPTQEDITSGKQFILRREEYARVLVAKIDDCLANAAQEIVTICYKYNVDPQKFAINSEYNEQMMAEIAEVMDNLEEEILDYIYEYSLAGFDNSSVFAGFPNERKSDMRSTIAAWIALLGRGNRNLQDTLEGYLYKAMKDWEAAITALRYAKVAMAAAVTKIKSHLHSIYTMPEVRATFDHADDFNATYIRNKGVQKGAVGISNNGSTNVTNMAKLTLQMAWMKEKAMEQEEDGAAGYYVLRGSSYPCDTCDSMVGFHEMEDIDGYPPYHGHCCCYVIPIFNLEDETQKESKDENNNNITAVDELPDELFDVYDDKENNISFKIAKDIDKSKSDYTDLINIAAEFTKSGKKVAILKPYHVKSGEYQRVFGRLAGTKYWGKNPDLLIGDKFYEYESYVRPFNNKKIGRMLSHGMVQSDLIIIDNKAQTMDWYIQKLIDARLKVGATINEVWLYDDSGIRLLFQQ